MLLFILSNYTTIRCSHFVSIHLMLLFIVSDIVFYMQLFCFNTSHVTLYPLWLNFRRLSQKSFNTSHVTLYRCPNRTHSGHYGRFNTSHVTLYPMERRIAETVNKFQYISCYSLSQSLQFLRLDPVVSIHLMLLFIDGMSGDAEIGASFQYISCYSLSQRRLFLLVQNAGFNTSHVTLYPSFYRLFFF